MRDKLTSLSLVEMMSKIEQTINEKPEPIQGLNVVYQFDITGEETGSYQLQVRDGQAKLDTQLKDSPDCTLQLSFKNFCKFLTGDLKGAVAFMTGKLKVQGDMTKALRLESLVKEYDFTL